MADKPNPFAKSTKDANREENAKLGFHGGHGKVTKGKKSSKDHGNALLAWLEDNKKKTKSKGKK